MAEGNTDNSVSEPKKIGFFSLDIGRVFRDDESEKKTFIEPNRNSDGDLIEPWDLTRGKMTNKRDEHDNENLNDLLTWITKHKQEIIIDGNMQTNFVCRRGLLKDVMSSGYEKYNKLRLVVTLHKGIYYLCRYPTEKKHPTGKKHPTEKKDDGEMGFKFEQYLSKRSTDSAPGHQDNNCNAGSTESVSIADMDYNSCQAYYHVMKLKLAHNTLVYSCEIDAVTTDGRKVEFKTFNLSILNQPNFKRYKLLKLWIQSFLGGVPKNMCGFRDDIDKDRYGIVKKLKEYETEKNTR